MKKILFVSLFLSSALFANTSEIRELNFRQIQSCYKGVNFYNSWMAVGKNQTTIFIKNMKTKKEQFLSLNDGYRDFIINDNFIYILSREKIDIYNLKEELYTDAISLENSKRSWPSSLYVKEDKLFVSSDKDGVRIYDISSLEMIDEIRPTGNVNSVFINDNIGYIYADTAGISGGMILSAVYLFNPSTNKIIHRTFINGAPAGGLFVNKKNVFLGESFHWQIRKKKIHKKKYIGRYKSVYIPRPQYAMGRAYRDDKNLFFCNSKASVIQRRNIER